MKKKLAGVLAAAFGAVGVLAIPASAAPPAEGQCVSSGVQAFSDFGGRNVIRDVATGQATDLGVPASVGVSTVILDHAFNSAEVTESLTGIDPCQD